jgi:hypothetical protein
MLPKWVGKPRGWVTKALNTAMIKRAKKARREIIDIGPDFLERALNKGKGSEWYELESRLTKGYAGLRRVWVRTSKSSGGISHWGEG